MMVFLVVVMFLFVVLVLFWFVFGKSNASNWSFRGGDS